MPITSLCPCSREISDYGAHNQRGSIEISVSFELSDDGEPLDFGDLIAVAEERGLGADLLPPQANGRALRHDAGLRKPRVRRGHHPRGRRSAQARSDEFARAAFASSMKRASTATTRTPRSSGLTDLSRNSASAHGQGRSQAPPEDRSRRCLLPTQARSRHRANSDSLRSTHPPRERAVRVATSASVRVEAPEQPRSGPLHRRPLARSLRGLRTRAAVLKPQRNCGSSPPATA